MEEQSGGSSKRVKKGSGILFTPSARRPIRTLGYHKSANDKFYRDRGNARRGRNREKKTAFNPVTRRGLVRNGALKVTGRGGSCLLGVRIVVTTLRKKKKRNIGDSVDTWSGDRGGTMTAENRHRDKTRAQGALTGQMNKCTREEPFWPKKRVSFAGERTPGRF